MSTTDPQPTAPSSMAWATIPAGRHQLGWSFDDQLPPAVQAALDAFMPRSERLQRFSPARSVQLAGFSIATHAFPAEELLGSVETLLDAVETLLDAGEDDSPRDALHLLCDTIDARLGPQGMRLPTEDELEAACGGSLFAWGRQVPDGRPWAGQTRFRAHLEPNGFGLQLNTNPYRVELTRCAFKLGDGGEAICGGYSWPIAWLSFCPSYRLAGVYAADLLCEFMEDAGIRPVRC